MPSGQAHLRALQREHQKSKRGGEEVIEAA